MVREGDVKGRGGGGWRKWEGEGGMESNIIYASKFSFPVRLIVYCSTCVLLVWSLSLILPEPMFL